MVHQHVGRRYLAVNDLGDLGQHPGVLGRVDHLEVISGAG
jgi:hypothetical protein